MNASRKTIPVEYEVDRNGILSWMGGGWTRFARENEGESLEPERLVGKRLLDFVQDSSTRHIIRMLEDRVRKTGQSIEYEYRCDSPRLKRFMKMEIRPVEEERLRYTSWTLREEPVPFAFSRSAGPGGVSRDPEGSDASDASHQILIVCSYCKRVELEGHWVEPDEALQMVPFRNATRFPDFSHGMCPDCYTRLFDLM